VLMVTNKRDFYIILKNFWGKEGVSIKGERK